MKKIFTLGFLFLLTACLCFGQIDNINEKEKEAIKNCALDYADGYYSGSGERMERALHPDLKKVNIAFLPKTDRTMLRFSSISELVEASRAKAGYRPEDKRKIMVTILDLDDDIACVKVNSSMFNDYLVMIKVNDKWKIINVLWALGPDFPNKPSLPELDNDNERKNITGVLNDYVGGMISGDIPRMEKTLHPEVSSANFFKFPQTGQSAITRRGYSGIIEPFKAKLAKIPENPPSPEISIMDIMDGMAFGQMKALNALTYYQLGYINSEWKIINILSKAYPAQKK